MIDEDRRFRVSLLQSTNTCKNLPKACAGGKYDPSPSPNLSKPTPRYNVGRLNRHDDVEDGAGLAGHVVGMA